MPKRKHFDAIGWGTATLIALGDVVSNAGTTYIAVSFSDPAHALDRKLWAGLAIAIGIQMLKTVFASMKNFGQYVTEEEISSATATTATGTEIAMKTVRTTTTPIDESTAKGDS